MPSTTTRSPGFRPSVMIQFVPTLSPTLTGRNVALFSGVTTITWYSDCTSITAGCGTSRAFLLSLVWMRTRPKPPGRRMASGLGNSAVI